MGRLRALVGKEFRQFFRRKPLVVLVVWTVAVVIALCAAAITYDVRHVRLAVQDLDGSPASRELVARFTASEYFDLAFRPGTPRELDGLLETGRATVGLVIPPDFSRQLGQGLEAPVQLLLDGSNSNHALVALGYAQRILTGRRSATRGPCPSSGASDARGTTRVSGACTSRSCRCSRPGP
jgi:ABC-2 type transport system permease protein